jgi:hypothetical protein
LEIGLTVKKRLVVTLSVVIIVIIILASGVLGVYLSPHEPELSSQPFYVGVTYCGNSIEEAKQLIDQVKNYTNLFVLQSGPLMYDVTASEKIGDYAVKSGLNIIISGSINSLGNNLNTMLSVAEQWENHFLGLYFNDEPAGHMLDSSYILLNDNNTSVSIAKNSDVIISFGNQSGAGLNTVITQYEFEIGSGTITKTTTISTFAPHDSPPTVTNITVNGTPVIPDQTVYYRNGTITYATDTMLIYEPNGKVFDENGQVITNQGNISQFVPYQQVWNLNPILNYTDAANFFVNNLKTTLSSIGNQSNVKLYTSDYGLYWFDYAGGYDTVFSEFGWNNSRQMVISQCRGAATNQNKDWGVMITWTYDHTPYLENATQLYDDMKLAYGNGASYVVVFNSDGESSGVLTNDQLNAVKDFWEYTRSNPRANGFNDRVAYVLPIEYGYDFHGLNGTIWGIWKADNFSDQQYANINIALQQYGSKLDVIFDDSSFSKYLGQYSRVIYWNGTITS